jgi:alkanesulfonate monooxygenase SsuD/methylene tetrahydromethanopterin reductase-like flavin-dependent oxidoreductase (luciferase family)
MADQPKQIGGGRRTMGTSLRSSPNGRWPRLLAGSPTATRDQIAQLTKATGVQEVMVQDVFADPKAHAHSRALLAQALGVLPAAVAAS